MPDVVSGVGSGDGGGWWLSIEAVVGIGGSKRERAIVSLREDLRFGAEKQRNRDGEGNFGKKYFLSSYQGYNSLNNIFYLLSLTDRLNC